LQAHQRAPGQEFELTTELIDPETGATVRSYKERSYGEDHILDTLDSIAGGCAPIWANRSMKSRTPIVLYPKSPHLR